MAQGGEGRKETEIGEKVEWEGKGAVGQVVQFQKGAGFVAGVTTLS